MTVRADVLTIILLAGLVAFFCRAGGFWLMRLIPASPRLEAALKATPLAVMIGIIAPAAVRGGPGEWLALAVVAGLARLGANDVVAAMGGVATVALFRAL